MILADGNVGHVPCRYQQRHAEEDSLQSVCHQYFDLRVLIREQKRPITRRDHAADPKHPRQRFQIDPRLCRYCRTNRCLSREIISGFSHAAIHR